MREQRRVTMWKTGEKLHDQHPLSRLAQIVEHPLVRWALTLAWTLIAASLMLSPSGDGTTVSSVSKVFGGTETSDAVGHVLINIVLAFLWCWTVSVYLSPALTLRVILIGGMVWCFGAELTQHFVPERGTSLLDLGANLLGVSVGLIAFRVYSQVVQPVSGDRQ